MSTPITNIAGIGPFAAKTLSEKGFHSLEDLAASDVASLTKVSGFGEIRAAQTIASALAYLAETGSEPSKKVKQEKKADKDKGRKKEKKAKKEKKDKAKSHKKDKKSDKSKKELKKK